jgi:preprotein translocase subunit SecF
MRLDQLPRSDNVEDRRGDAGSGSGGSRMPGGRSGLGIIAIILLGLLGWWLGIDPGLLIGGADIFTGGGRSQQEQQQQQNQKNQDQQKKDQGKDQDKNQGQDKGKDQQQQSQQDQQQKQQQPKPDDQKQDQPKPEPSQPKQEPQEQQAQASHAGNLDKQQAKALLDNLREDERNWNFFPEVQMKDLKDTGEPAKDW